VRFVFTVVLVIFIFCVLTTLTSFKEIPLDILTNPFKVTLTYFIFLSCFCFVQRKSVSGQSEVKYDAVPKYELGQGLEGYEAIQLNVTDTTNNPFTGTGNLHRNLTEEQANQTNGNDHLQATESSFSQAVSY
jgi:energy-coupling factor transporter transmembrane protein EcfT